ncbi:hypothetical protein CPB84DRAFT_1963754 [Gymnopilus junonius]|uniref:F-box domain-containing protein n=1 Tax=Gymnopilus junonius TaxID=109634 RepID=A0A9P5TLU5_GYMJU|nr:hypothetical protein CPB84DRAFT_1963754 [Gymnopilus junonius]
MDRRRDFTTRLSGDIISTIFEFSIPYISFFFDPEEYGEGYPSKYLQERATTPLRVSGTCRRWRHIAQSTSRLWTFIFIMLDSPHIATAILFARECVDRSRSLPLTIHVCVNDSAQYRAASLSSSLNVLNKVGDIIQHHSARWDSLNISWLPSSFFPFLIGNLPMPALHSLRLQGDSQDVVPGYSHLDFTLSPNLVDVELAHFSLESVRINWQNVRAIGVANIDIDEMVELLKRAPNIKTVTYSRAVNVDPSPINNIIQHGLNDFQIKFGQFEDEAMDVLLDGLDFPSIEKLTFITIHVLPSRALSDLIQRSDGHLKELKLVHTYFPSWRKMVSFLQDIPSLETLYLVPQEICDFKPRRFFRYLAETWCRSFPDEDDHRPVFLPNLTSLTCVFNFNNRDPQAPRRPGFSWNDISYMFGPLSELKNPHRRPLRHFEFYVDYQPERDYKEDDLYKIPKSALARIKYLLEAGMEIVITWSINEKPCGIDLISFHEDEDEGEDDPGESEEEYDDDDDDDSVDTNNYSDESEDDDEREDEVGNMNTA